MIEDLALDMAGKRYALNISQRFLSIQQDHHMPKIRVRALEAAVDAHLGLERRPTDGDPTAL